MPRAGLSAQALVEEAAELADAEGLEAVTLTALARRLGVRPPSLYAHVDGLGDLRERLAARGAEQLGDALTAATAGRAGSDALAALAAAYRAYAREHPGSYAALQRPGGRRAKDAAGRVLEVVTAVLAGYGLRGDEALHLVRALRSALHGFVSLEAQEGFGLALDTDQSFEAMIALLDCGLRRA